MNFNSFSADVLMFQDQIQDPALSCQVPLASESQWQFLFISLSFMILFIYLAAPGGPCGIFCRMWDLWSSLWPAESLVAARSTLVGSTSMIRDWTWAPCTGSMESQPLDLQEVPTLTLLRRALLLNGPQLGFACFPWLKWSNAFLGGQEYHINDAVSFSVQRMRHVTMSCGWYWPESLG